MSSRERLHQFEPNADDETSSSASTSGAAENGCTPRAEGSDDEEDDQGNEEVDGDQDDDDSDGGEAVDKDDDDQETSSESDEEGQEVDRENGNVSIRSAKAPSLLSKPKIGLFASKNLGRIAGGKANAQTKTRIRLSLKLPTMKNATPSNFSRPMMKKIKLPMSRGTSSGPSSDGSAIDDEEDEPNEVQAMVIDSDEAGEDDAVATAVPESPEKVTIASKLKPSIGPSTVKKTTIKNVNMTASPSASSPKVVNGLSKRRSFHPSRQIRIPPISSPGLLMPPPTQSGNQGGLKNQQSVKPNIAGFCTPSDVFDNAMEASGYTLQKRTQHPHRGSSVKRTVDDMFDSNVKLSLRFPELLPKALLSHSSQITIKSEPKEDHSPNNLKTQEPMDESLDKLKGDGSIRCLANTGAGETSLTLPQKLIKCMEKGHRSSREPIQHGEIPSRIYASQKVARRRKRPLTFLDMAPVSLTLPYPESYIQRRLEYVNAVMQREKAIVDWQEAHETSELSSEEQREATDMMISNDSNGRASRTDTSEPSNLNPFTIPPIPEPGEPPTIDEMKEYKDSNMYRHDQHPFYLPGEKNGLVAHLNLNCFHITEGRYFGLRSNFVADPNFVGANAPGIAPVSNSGGAGLATSTLGSGSSSGGMAFVLSSSYHSAAASTASQTRVISTNRDTATTNHDSTKSSVSLSTSNGHVHNKTPSSSLAKGKPIAKKPAAGSPASTKKSASGSKPTASTSDLRKIMEDGGSQAEALKMCIIRAAVHASRVGKHGQSFMGPNGETYPDVSKAFAIYAGIKPCLRCKSNKQGVYHCRLRRRHQEEDYDGGNSPAVLSPLFKEPV